MGLVKWIYVTGPDEPCDISGEVRPPKAVNDVCTCGKVSVMSGSENCWLFVAVDDYFMTTLRIPSPKVTILLEEVLGVTQECGVGESQGMFGGAEPFVNMAQMVVGSAVMSLLIR